MGRDPLQVFKEEANIGKKKNGRVDMQSCLSFFDFCLCSTLDQLPGRTVCYQPIVVRSYQYGTVIIGFPVDSQNIDRWKAILMSDYFHGPGRSERSQYLRTWIRILTFWDFDRWFHFSGRQVIGDSKGRIHESPLSFTFCVTKWPPWVLFE
jgi:hypothetical protein